MQVTVNILKKKKKVKKNQCKLITPSFPRIHCDGMYAFFFFFYDFTFNSFRTLEEREAGGGGGEYLRAQRISNSYSCRDGRSWNRKSSVFETFYKTLRGISYWFQFIQFGVRYDLGLGWLHRIWVLLPDAKNRTPVPLFTSGESEVTMWFLFCCFSSSGLDE